MSKSSSRTGPIRRNAIDAITLLTRDHGTARRLLRQLAKTTTRGASRRRALLEQVAKEVQIHARIEEEIFYPAFREAARSGDDEMLFLEAAEEHGLVHIVLPQLQKTDPKTELFSARAKVLKDLVEHHAEEEEKQLFPRARKLMGLAERQELGELLQQRRLALGSGVVTRPPRASRG
jgi:hemerythrin superfamily protein